jgi:hypothetical protein
MILCTDLNKHRLGNALFKIAFVKALSIRFKQDYALPSWEYAKYFCMEDRWSDVKWLSSVKIREPSFDYSPIENKYHSVNVDYMGYWQSFKYFYKEWDAIKDEFRWEKSFLDGIWERTDFRPGLNDWCVHIRLKDYVNNPNYVRLTPEYYIEFFRSNPDKQYYIFSDHIPDARKMVGLWPNVQFVGGSTDIEDLALMSQFKNFIIANSSFSWWAAHLAELYDQGSERDIQVIRPDGLFAGELAKTCTGKDFYKPEWQIKPVHNIKIVKNKKIDLKDFTVVTVVCIDSNDRRENLQLMLEYLHKHYDTNFIIGETGTRECEFVQELPNTQYVYFEDDKFHRTKYLNTMMRMATTPYIINHDVDIIVPVSQMEEAANLLRTGIEFAYPYSGGFCRIERSYYSEIKATLDVSKLGTFFRGADDDSVGGCVLVNKEAHFRVGGEAENYVNFGAEDRSRFDRYDLFGKCKRVQGVIYHLEHFLGPYSQGHHEYIVITRSEIRKERSLSKSKYWEYIHSKDWNRIK